MLTEDQIEAIAKSLHYQEDDGFWDDLPQSTKDRYFNATKHVAETAIATVRPYAEQDRRSFIAVGEYIGVTFTSKTDVVSEVYKKLEEIMTVFREHSQEIAIAQQIKNLTNLLEKYGKQQEASHIQAGAVGAEERVSVRDREVSQ